MTQTVLLGDVVQIKGGKRLPKGKRLQDAPNSHPYLRIVDMGQKNIIKTSLQYVPDKVFLKISRYITNTNDVLISIVGTIGLISLVDDDLDNASLTENCVKLTCDTEKINPEFLYYFLSSSTGQNEIHAGRVGSTQPKLPLYNVTKIKIPNLSLRKQTEIADILRVLDEKIELNRKMNETLERMGQALFRHYFVDNLEVETWQKRPLGDFVDLVNGTSYKSSELKPSMNALVTLKSIERGGGFSRRGYKEFTGKMKDTQIVIDGDLIVAHTDLTQKAEVAGYPALVDGAGQYKQVAISMDLVKVIPRDQELSTSVVYFLLGTREFQDYKMGFINGSTVLHLNKKCIPSYEIAFPNNVETLQSISSSFDGLMEKIKVNNQETQTLTSIRDTLLPRLISGKIKL